MGADSGFWTEAKLDELRALVAEDLPYRLIGKRLGCTKNMAMGKARRLKIATTRKPGKYPALTALEVPKPKPVIKKKASVWAQTPKPDKPRPTPRIRTADVATADVPMIEVTGCLYPTNNAPPYGEHLFCDRPKPPAHSYCAEHAAICFTAVPPPRHLVPADTSARARATAAFRTWRTA